MSDSIPSFDLQEYYNKLVAIGYFADDDRAPLPYMLNHNLVSTNKCNYNQYHEIPTQNDYNIEYISIPKNGTHYVINKFKIESENQCKGVGAARIPPSAQLACGTIEKSIFNNNNNYKMVIIREPISRAISSYQEMLKLREDCPWSTPITRKLMFYKTRDNVEKSFAYFLHEIYKYGFYDQHMFSQYECINNELLYYKSFKNNIFILFENMKDELEEVAKIHKIDSISDEEAKSQFINKGSSEVKERIMKLITENDKYLKVIKHLYSEDFKLYEKVKNEDRFYR